MSDDRAPTCRRCSEPLATEREVCLPCAEAIRASVGPEAMAELARYWERRLVEGTERDWT